jgi:cation transport protein ChaC
LPDATLPELDLTADLVARIPPDPADYPEPPGTVAKGEADYARVVDEILAHSPGGPVRIFAYGSLLWKPAFTPVGSAPAVAQGWHRSFCIHVRHRRGSPVRPGLMMSLDRGGSCRGLVLEVTRDQAESVLAGLVRREMRNRPSTNIPRWIVVKGEAGPARALAFTASRSGASYAGRLPRREVARLLATGVGSWGSCAEYLRNTVLRLEALGIRDRNLWTLQRLVARELSRVTDTIAPCLDPGLTETGH